MHVKKRSGGLISRVWRSFWSGTSGTTSCLMTKYLLWIARTWNHRQTISQWPVISVCTNWPPGMSSWAFPRFWKDTVWVQTAHAENQTVFACQKGKKDSTETSTCTVWYCHRGLTLISKCLGLLLKVPPPKKIQIKNPLSQFTFTFDVSVNFYLAGNNESSSTRLLSDLRPRWAIHRTLIRFR